MKEELIKLADEMHFRSMFFPSNILLVSYKEKKKHFLWMCEFQQWIRNTFNIDIVIVPNTLGYEYVIYYRYPPKVERNRDFFQTYEETLQVALVKVIKLIRDEDNSNQDNTGDT